MMFAYYACPAASAQAADPVQNSLRKRNTPPDREGNIVVPTVVLIVVLIGAVAFAVDVGYIAHVETTLQRTADAAALAAASKLPDESVANATAFTVAKENGWVSGVKIGEGDELNGSDLDPLDVYFGYWDRDTATFTDPAPYNRDVNAVRVIIRRTEATNNPLRLFFGRVFGVDTTDVEVSATALYDRWLCGPFIGIDWLSVPGSPNTDSYNSEEGLYDPATARDRGSICSDGPINIDGTSLIRGDARSGKNHDVTMTGNTIVTRSIGRRLKPLNLEPVDASIAAVNNDNAQVPLLKTGNSYVSPVDEYGNFLLDGNKELTMPPGTYYFNDMTLAGSAIFNVPGPDPVIIYLTGNLFRAGTTWVGNDTKKPINLQFILTGGTATVTSNNDFYGVIYAPNSDVIVDGGSDYFGAILGRTLTITGSGEGHYDESLNMEHIEFPSRTTLVD